MLRLEDLMQRDVVIVSPDLTLRELVEVFTDQEVSGAPVVAGGKVVGVVSTTDIFDFREETAGSGIRPGALGDTERPAYRQGAWDSLEPAEFSTLDWMRTTRDRDWDLLDEYTVADVMTREVVSLEPSTSVKMAASYMMENGIHRVLVIEAGVLHGIVSTTDLVRAIADGKLNG